MFSYTVHRGLRPPFLLPQDSHQLPQSHSCLDTKPHDHHVWKAFEFKYLSRNYEVNLHLIVKRFCFLSIHLSFQVHQSVFTFSLSSNLLFKSQFWLTQPYLLKHQVHFVSPSTFYSSLTFSLTLPTLTSIQSFSTYLMYLLTTSQCQQCIHSSMHPQPLYFEEYFHIAPALNFTPRCIFQVRPWTQSFWSSLLSFIWSTRFNPQVYLHTLLDLLLLFGFLWSFEVFQVRGFQVVTLVLCTWLLW